MVAKRVPWRLNRLLRTLTENLDRAVEETVIEKDWLDSTEGGRLSRLHSRVLGILAKTGFDLKYTVGIETGFRSGKSKSFEPDIQLWEKNRLRFLIEYEGTNSSDSRIIDKDLDHCYHALSAARGQDVELPDFWVIIYTLPDGTPTNWYHHDYRAKKDRNAYLEMTKDPHRFYKKAFMNPAFLTGRYYPNRWRKDKIRAKDCHSISECSIEARTANPEVLLVNLTKKSLKIDFPSRLNREYEFTSASGVRDD